MSPGIYITLYTESIADQTDHFADVVVHENVVYGYDVVTFKCLQPAPFCLEKRKGIFLCFDSVFGANSIGIRLDMKE